MNSYFDFHFHPLFKQYMSQYEDRFPTARTVADLDDRVQPTSFAMKLIDEVALHFLASQCSLPDCRNGGVRLGVAAIAPTELGFAASSNYFGKLLQSKATRPLDPTYFQKVREGGVSYFRLLMKELDMYRTMKNAKIIKMLSRATPSLGNGVGGNMPAFVLGIEGGHALRRKTVGIDGRSDAENAKREKQGENPAYNDLIANPDLSAADSLKSLQARLWDEGLDLFYLTLTHLSFIPEQNLATHAFGMKMLRHDAFYPEGNGLTQAGREVVEAAYTLKVSGKKPASGPAKINDARVLIDIKHMSLKSRQDLIALRSEKGWGDIPLIASHVGVTGYTIPAWKAATEKFERLKRGIVDVVRLRTEPKVAGKGDGILNRKFTFNPWTINLMDEEIAAVIQSNGLIGISLDVRILGWMGFASTVKSGIFSDHPGDYLAAAEAKHFFPNATFERTTVEIMEMAEEQLVEDRSERQTKAFCFNLLHAASVGKRRVPGRDPWKHLCIGSDYDGLINPVKIASSSAEMPDLEVVLPDMLVDAEEEYRKENGGPELLPRSGNQIDYAALQRLVRDVMFENGKAFLERAGF